MKRLLMLLPIALTACGPKPPIAVQIREIPVPTPVACVDPATIPAEPPKVGDTLTGNPVIDSMILAESALELRKYGGELRALIKGCV